jgi:hypothetical protein
LKRDLLDIGHWKERPIRYWQKRPIRYWQKEEKEVDHCLVGWGLGVWGFGAGVGGLGLGFRVELVYECTEREKRLPFLPIILAKETYNIDKRDL